MKTPAVRNTEFDNKQLHQALCEWCTMHKWWCICVKTLSLLYCNEIKTIYNGCIERFIPCQAWHIHSHGLFTGFIIFINLCSTLQLAQAFIYWKNWKLNSVTDNVYLLTQCLLTYRANIRVHTRTFHLLPQLLHRTNVVIGSSALRVWTCIHQNLYIITSAILS